MRPTQRKRRRRRTGAGKRFLILLSAMAMVICLLMLAFQLAEGRKTVAEVSPAFAVTPPVETPAPTPTPEPTPALPDVDINDWSLRLIRYEYPLGEDFVPESLTDVGDNERMDGRVAPALTALIEAARADGHSVYVCSGYRDYDTQSWIYWNHIDTYEAQGMTYEEADAATRLAVNYPGSSEHQSGLSVDLLESPQQDMEPYIGGSGLMLWLEQHCADYGFVIRYPDGKTDITGVEYEPWHLRYVGGTAARYMMDNGLCLEEFLALYDEAYQAFTQ